MLNPTESVDFAKIGDPKFKKWKPISKRLDVLAKQNCTVCGIPTDERCSSCFFTPFCSEKHWNKVKDEHATICGKQMGVKMIQAKDTSQPPYLVFTAAMEKRKMFMIENPLAVLPVLPEGFTEDKTQLLDGLKLVCFGCNSHFSRHIKLVSCASCGIRLCSEACPKFYHEVQECKILRKFSGRNFDKPYMENARKYIELYLDMCVLRILYYFAVGSINPHTAFQWKCFLNLSKTQRYKYYTKSTPDFYDGRRYFEFMKKSVDVLKFSLAYAKYNREIVQQVFKTMVVFWEEYEMTPGIKSRIIFLDRHFMAASHCSPNVATCIDSTENVHTWSFYTIQKVNLKPNKSPTDNVVAFDFSPSCFMSLPLRINYLSERGLDCFNCKSSKSTLCYGDPSDGNTNSGSIRCEQCSEGIYIEDKVRGKELLDDLPKRWSKEYIDTVDWKCNKCDDVQPFSRILEVNQVCYKYWKDLAANGVYCKITATSQFIDFYEDSTLHPSNGVILEAKYAFLMATREKHLWECGLTPNGVVINKNHLPRLAYDLRIFPMRWDLKELEITKRRARYAYDCQQYLTSIKSYPSPELSELMYLELECSTMQLLLSCYEFFMSLNIDAAINFKEAILSVFKVVNNMAIKKIQGPGNINFLMESKLLKWPQPELDMLKRLVKPNTHPLFVGVLILKMMNIKLLEFTMGQGAFAKEREFDGADDWPMSFRLLCDDLNK